MQTSKKRTTRASGLIYRVGVATMLTGVMISVSSGFFGGIVFAGTSKLLEALNAPELPTTEGAETGSVFILVFGFGVFLSGVFIYSLRLLIELVGFPVERHLSRWFTLGDKLFLGTATISTLVVILSIIPLIVFEAVFLDNPAVELTSLLNSTLTACAWLMVGGFVMFFFRRRYTLPKVCRRFNSFGWSKLGWIWVNLLGSGLILFAFIVPGFGLSSLFGLSMNAITGTGLVMILTGIIPHFLARDKP